MSEVREIGRREELAEAIVKLEWIQFQGVQNEGGRASCQNDRGTFWIMRKSQFLTWDEETLESYLADLEEAESWGWNLLTEKYARMMESTAPAQYEGLKEALPVRSLERQKEQEAIISLQVRWAEEFTRRCPNLGASGRKIHTWEDTEWDTSMETYLRGELGTYSDRTLALYGAMVRRMEAEGKNLTEEDLKVMAGFYGYGSLEEAERSQRSELR